MNSLEREFSLQLVICIWLFVRQRKINGMIHLIKKIDEHHLFYFAEA
jgi:hypothetical protein